MAAISMTLVGNLVADPERKETPSGRVVSRFRVATNDGYRGATGEYVELEPVFNDCEAWGEAAEAASQLHKGAAVIVVGEQRQQNWETPEGAKRARRYVHVSALGIDQARRKARAAEEGGGQAAPVSDAAGEWEQEG